MLKFTNTYSFKLLIIAVLAFLLLIPSLFIRETIGERKGRRAEAIAEISSKWGGAQTLTGPFLTIPFKKFFLDSLGQRKYFVSRYHILPSLLEIKASLTPEVRYRGIYETVLYKSRVRIRSEIDIPANLLLDTAENELLRDKAEINIGISDLKGIASIGKFLVNGKEYKLSPGTKNSDVIDQGLGLGLGIKGFADKLIVDFEVDLNGSENIGFHPVGEVTRAEIDGLWKHPSFTGAYLPFERRIDDSSFSAKWKVLHLNRNYPQSWEGTAYGLRGSDFKVELLLAMDVYSKSTRVVKYALLFILITFVGFFFSEIVSRKRIHPIQYLLIGFAILLFYVLLLSLSEHVNFDLAYVMSSVMSILLIGLYTKGILGSGLFGVYISVILVILYAYYYILLQLQDYALLIGALGLFAVLSLFMFFTRKINWYKVEVQE